MMAPETVRADQSKGLWVLVTMTGEQETRVKVSVVREHGRGFVHLSFKHPTCGSVTNFELARNHQLTIAP
jgi:hypothetical protein